MELTDAQVAVAAAQAGAAVAHRHYRTAVERHLKAGTDFATDADLEAETAVRALLGEHRPQDAQLGEEHGPSGPDSERRWLVDPICGTRNFAAGLPLMCTNVALTVDGAVTASAAAECVGDETYWTDGEQAWVRRGGADVPMRPDAGSLMVAFDLEVGAEARRRFSEVLADPAFVATFQPRITSSTLALAWVAAGRHAGYATDTDPSGNVHYAAGLGLCLAAGCVVTDLDGRDVTSREGGRRGLLVAADEPTHRDLLALLR